MGGVNGTANANSNANANANGNANASARGSTIALRERCTGELKKSVNTENQCNSMSAILSVLILLHVVKCCDDDNLSVLHPFQQYFSHIRTTGKALQRSAVSVKDWKIISPAAGLEPTSTYADVECIEHLATQILLELPKQSFLKLMAY